MSWKRGEGFFERSSDMVFALQRRKIGKKIKQCPVMLYLASQRIVKHWHARWQNWDMVLCQLQIMFAEAPQNFV